MLSNNLQITALTILGLGLTSIYYYKNRSSNEKKNEKEFKESELKESELKESELKESESNFDAIYNNQFENNNLNDKYHNKLFKKYNKLFLKEDTLDNTKNINYLRKTDLLNEINNFDNLIKIIKNLNE